MAKFKQGARGVQVKLNKKDAGIIYNYGQGIHLLLPEHLANILRTLNKDNFEEISSKMEMYDVMFLQLYMKMMELQHELGMDSDWSSQVPKKYE